MSLPDTLPSLRPEPNSGSANTRTAQPRPQPLMLEPRPVTRVKETQSKACEFCDEIPQTIHEATLARTEARLAREEARLIRDEVRLAQARAQTEIRKESQQIREEMHKMCAEIHQLQQFKTNQIRRSPTVTLPPDSPKTPNAMEEMDFSVQEDEEGSH